MPTPVVPIRVKIGLRPNGHADHPAWELLPMIAAEVSASAARDLIDAAVRKHTVGSWHYDKSSGHTVETPESPRGMQWGMLLVSKAFADQAVVAFPALVTILTQAECQAFWDTKAYAHIADEDFNIETLQGLKLSRSAKRPEEGRYRPGGSGGGRQDRQGPRPARCVPGREKEHAKAMGGREGSAWRRV